MLTASTSPFSAEWLGSRRLGYSGRARVEAQIGRYKAVIESGPKSRRIRRQVNETKIATKSLNGINCLDRAVFKRAA